MRHVPASVAELGKMLRIPKLAFAPDSPEYCVRDAKISFRFAVKLREIYTAMGAVAKTTLPATAYHLWATRYFDRPVIEAPTELRAAAREAYHGGRTECFYAGDAANVSVIDASSMFPWAMCAEAFPVPWGPVRRSKEIASITLARAEIQSELALPVLPARSDKGTLYPNGRWRDWYVGEELRYAESCGAKVRIIEGYEYLQTIRPFDGYVTTMYEGKSRSRGPVRLMYKLLLNSLYGKFGQMGSRICCTPLDRFMESGRPTDGVRVWCGLAIYRVDASPPPWGNQIWSALVTARARIRLHQMICALRDSGAKILYCDTDSIMYCGGALKFPVKAARPGDFESRGHYPKAMFVGKKEYGLCSIDEKKGQGGEIWELHAKGIPMAARARYMQTGTTDFERPVRLIESGRVGIAPNVWRKVSKTRRTTLATRDRRSDGTLLPVIVTE